jgi:hypothetical protein
MYLRAVNLSSGLLDTGQWNKHEISGDPATPRAYALREISVRCALGTKGDPPFLLQRNCRSRTERGVPLDATFDLLQDSINQRIQY